MGSQHLCSWLETPLPPGSARGWLRSHLGPRVTVWARPCDLPNEAPFAKAEPVSVSSRLLSPGNGLPPRACVWRGL